AEGPGPEPPILRDRLLGRQARGREERRVVDQPSEQGQARVRFNGHLALRYESSVECVGPSGSGEYASGDPGWIPASLPAGAPPAASCTSRSSAARTCLTCWLTIGWRTRWPIEPTGPAIRTSASQRIDVPPPASSRWHAVVIRISAPTPWPFASSFAKSGSRSSVFSKLIFIWRAPRPSGIFTFAIQWRSSETSKLSTPGIVFAIRAGSLSTAQTVARGAANACVPSILTRP